LSEAGITEKLKGIGLLVVEGPNDVIALDALGVPAVGLCSNTITDEQVGKLSRLANEIGGGVVTLMMDADTEGESGARQAIVEIAQRCAVRFAWSPSMHAGKYKGRQPESLRPEEWEMISGFLRESEDAERR